MPKIIKLQQCPFCGLNAAYITENKCLYNGYVSYKLHHSVNSCILSGWDDGNVYPSEKQAASVWNYRGKARYLTNNENS